jgi:hypothetical protein
VHVRRSPLGGNRNAGRPVDAILNYAYAALESETRIKAIGTAVIQRLHYARG